GTRRYRRAQSVSPTSCFCGAKSSDLSDECLVGWWCRFLPMVTNYFARLRFWRTRKGTTCTTRVKTYDEIYSLATTGGTCHLHAFGMDAISCPVAVLAPIRISVG